MGLDDILNLVPIDDIASKFGVSNDVAKQAVEEGGSVLLSGLKQNASSAEGSAAIEAALKKHEGTGAAARVDDIDTADGGKIVKHVLGDKADAVANELTNSSKTAGIDFGKLLPILAPIVMGLIANGMKNKSTSGASADGGLDLGGLIGGLLGGGNSTASASGGGLDLGGILGGLGGLFGKK